MHSIVAPLTLKAIKEVGTEGEHLIVVTRDSAIIATWGSAGAEFLASPDLLKTPTTTKGKGKGKEPMVYAVLDKLLCLTLAIEEENGSDILSLHYYKVQES